MSDERDPRERRGLTNDELLGRLTNLVLAGMEEGEPACETDSEWTCDRCRTRLGIVDVTDGTIRRKYRDSMDYTTLGEGGKITVPCRRCAHPNVITSADIAQIREHVLRAAVKGA